MSAVPELCVSSDGKGNAEWIADRLLDLWQTGQGGQTLGPAPDRRNVGQVQGRTPTGENPLSLPLPPEVLPKARREAWLSMEEAGSKDVTT